MLPKYLGSAEQPAISRKIILSLSPFFPQSLRRFVGAVSIALCTATMAYASPITITGVTGDRLSSGFTTTASSLEYTSGGSGEAFGGSGVLFCLDIYTHFPDANSLQTYNVVDGIATHPAALPRALDLYNWVYDQYYAGIFLNPNGDNNNEAYGFNAVFWEIRHDFDGSLQSLDAHAGTIKVANYAEYVKILDSLKTADIAIGYRSKDVDMFFLDDQDPYYQDMMLITPRSNDPSQVPEPGSLALVAMGGLAWLGRNKYGRNARKSRV